MKRMGKGYDIRTYSTYIHTHVQWNFLNGLPFKRNPPYVRHLDRKKCFPHVHIHLASSTLETSVFQIVNLVTYYAVSAIQFVTA